MGRFVLLDMESHGMIRRATVPLLALLTAAASGCGGSQSGTVEGRVVIEIGVTSQYASHSMLEVKSGNEIVATQKVSQTATYSFTVAAGTYTFADLSTRNCSGSVSIRSGQTRHHDVICTPYPAVG